MSTTPPVPWRSSCDLVNEPFSETEWLIQEILPKNALVLFSGREGSMKTWLALDWAFSVAEGTPWLTRECQSEAVLYLDAENPYQVFRERVGAVGASQNWNVWRWQDPVFPITLADSQLLAAAQEHRLIIIDSLRRFMQGREENSATAQFPRHIPHELCMRPQWVLWRLEYRDEQPKKIPYKPRNPDQNRQMSAFGPALGRIPTVSAEGCGATDSAVRAPSVDGRREGREPFRYRRAGVG